MFYFWVDGHEMRVVEADGVSFGVCLFVCLFEYFGRFGGGEGGFCCVLLHMGWCAVLPAIPADSRRGDGAFFDCARRTETDKQTPSTDL